MKRFVCLALAFLVMFGLFVPVNAADNGSVEVLVKYETTNVTGGDLIAVRVGYVDTDKNIFRTFITNSEITNIGNAATVTQMQNFYTTYKNTYTFDQYKTEVKDGVAKFSDIPTGLYLVYQDVAASGFSKLSSFLVTVPYDGKLDVSVASKTALKQDADLIIGADSSDSSGSSGSSGSTGSTKLPQTGQLIWPIPCMALGGMVLFAFGWWLYFGRKEDSQ